MDASCGPSNGMKSLQRHFDNDQSLHQSRIRSGQSNQAFRQAPTQEQINLASQEHQAFLNGSRSDSFVPLPRQQVLQNSTWSQDFQNSLPSIQSTQQTPLQASRGASLQGTWGAEFLSMAAPSSMTRQHAQLPHHNMNHVNGQPLYLGHPTLFAASQQSHPDIINAASAHHTTSFDDAFAEAEASLLAHRVAEESITGAQQEERELVGLTSDQREAYHQAEDMAMMDHAAVERMSDLETREEVERRFEGDALASTAGDLIHNMRDERSEKFKNSNFMALMHKLRDREVVVDDGKMVDAVSREEVGGNQTRDIDALVSERNQLQDVVVD